MRGPWRRSLHFNHPPCCHASRLHTHPSAPFAPPQAVAKDVGEAELERAKAAAVSSVLMNLESRAVVAEDIGRQVGAARTAGLRRSGARGTRAGARWLAVHARWRAPGALQRLDPPCPRAPASPPPRARC